MGFRSFAFFLLFALVLTGPVLGQDSVAKRVPLIMIDPGHGGNSVAGSLDERSNSSPNNAKSPSGIFEKDLTLEFSKVLREEIFAVANERGEKLGVVLTREKDVNLDFKTRAAYCNQQGATCVVSIHFNADGVGKSKGSLALISNPKRNPNYEMDEKFGKALAAACSEGVQKLLPSSYSRGTITDGHLHGGLGSNFFFQMARLPQLKNIPKCFLEVEFIDNAEVERAILKGDRIANFRTIARPVAEFLVNHALGER
ncbi:MAG: hypothetical protein CMO55_10455 [Verrucomicrobiales bacterium]|nr:hypothetical protein [Verrucomicrobiales bacterium]